MLGSINVKSINRTLSEYERTNVEIPMFVKHFTTWVVEISRVCWHQGKENHANYAQRRKQSPPTATELSESSLIADLSHYRRHGGCLIGWSNILKQRLLLARNAPGFPP